MQQYAVIQALQVGLGVLVGVYLISWVADRHGRRPAILLATLLGGICVWPFAYITDFWGMAFLSVLSTLGVAGIIATYSVYLSEMISPTWRIRALVAVSVNLLAFALFPVQRQLFLWISAGIEVVILLSLLYWKLPESPRWLEVHWRHDEANQVMAIYEARVQARCADRLPAPAVGRHSVTLAGKGTWREIFVNPQYRGRTLVRIAC